MEKQWKVRFQCSHVANGLEVSWEERHQVGAPTKMDAIARAAKICQASRIESVLWVEQADDGRRQNPWLKENWNLTEQARLFTENPMLAETLMAAAGLFDTDAALRELGITEVLEEGEEGRDHE